MNKQKPSHAEPDKKLASSGRPIRRMPWWGWLLVGIGAVFLVLAGSYLHTIVINPINAFNTPSPDPTLAFTISNTPGKASTPVSTITPDPMDTLLSQADLEFLKNKVNILMLGYDASEERYDEDSELYRDEENNFRSDVLMLLSVDFENNNAVLISIPRDTLAPIYNTEGHWKINAAFAKGGAVKGNGFEYAMRTVSNLFGGVPITYYAGIDMTGLKQVVDAMGGVDYDVDVKITLNGRVLETGMQHLNGQQVLDYCRARKGIGTDINRVDRQQRMLFTIFEQLKSRNQIVNLPNIYLSVQDKIITNLNFQQIAALSVFALDLDMDDLERYTLKGEYVNGTSYSNASFYVLHNDELAELVKSIFGITISPDIRYDADYVLGEKAAALVEAYIDAADYLLTTYLMPEFPIDSGGCIVFPANPDNVKYPASYLTGQFPTDQHKLLAQQTVEARDKCIKLIARGENEIKLLDSKEIEQANNKLKSKLIDAATGIGLSRLDFAASHAYMPKDIVLMLPAQPALPPAATTPENNSGFTDTFQ